MLEKITINYNPMYREVNQLFKNIDSWVEANDPDSSQFQLVDPNAPIEELFVNGFEDFYELTDDLFETLAEKGMHRPIQFDFQNHGFIRIDSPSSDSDYTLYLESSRLWTNVDICEPIHTAQLYQQLIIDPPEAISRYLDGFSLGTPAERRAIRTQRVNDMFFNNTGPFTLKPLDNFPFFSKWDEDYSNWVIEYDPEKDMATNDDQLMPIVYFPETDAELGGIYVPLDNSADDDLWAKLANPGRLIRQDQCQYAIIKHCIRVNDSGATIIDPNRLLGRLGILENYPYPDVKTLSHYVFRLSRREYEYLLMNKSFD